MSTDLNQTRATNLDLLRWRYGRHEDLAQRLKGVVTWNQLSEFATGRKVMPDYAARAIERHLKLEEGWVDRANLELLDSSANEFEMFALVRGVPPELKVAIKTILVHTNGAAAV